MDSICCVPWHIAAVLGYFLWRTGQGGRARSGYIGIIPRKVLHVKVLFYRFRVMAFITTQPRAPRRYTHHELKSKVRCTNHSTILQDKKLRRFSARTFRLQRSCSLCTPKVKQLTKPFIHIPGSQNPQQMRCRLQICRVYLLYHIDKRTKPYTMSPELILQLWLYESFWNALCVNTCFDK